MTKLYIIRRPFKSCGVFYDRGDIIKDTHLPQIKRYKTKLIEKKIIPIPTDAQELKELDYYFQEKFGISLIDKLKKITAKKPKVKKVGEWYGLEL